MIRFEQVVRQTTQPQTMAAARFVEAMVRLSWSELRLRGTQTDRVREFLSQAATEAAQALTHEQLGQAFELVRMKEGSRISYCTKLDAVRFYLYDELDSQRHMFCFNKDFIASLAPRAIPSPTNVMPVETAPLST